MTSARVGDLSFCPACCHSCPACCHAVIGPLISGSPDAFLNGRAIARAQMADNGVHCCCCSSNTWATLCGTSDIILNGIPLARLNDCTKHCGGIGSFVTSSEDTNTNY